MCAANAHAQSILAAVTSTTVVLVSSAELASPVSADPLASLTNVVDTIRSASGCPPLQADPLVTRVAEMATHATSDYIHHRTAAIPFDGDAMPALKTIGYRGGHAMLMQGYGDTETKAIHGLALLAWDPAAIPKCAYTQYGISAIQDDGAVFTAVLLAGP